MMAKRPKTSRSRGTTKRHVWVVIHCEYMPHTDAIDTVPFVDEMVFHVASSLQAAERYARARNGSPYGWWMIQRRAVDEPDEDADDSPLTCYFNHRGQPRKKPPHATARRAFDTWWRNEGAALRQPS